MKRYTIFVLNKEADSTVYRHGPTGPVKRPNPGTPPKYPTTFKACVYSDHSDRYGDDYTRRLELWEDTAGVATDEQIYAACPGLRDFVAHQLRFNANYDLGQRVKPYLEMEREQWPYLRSEAEAWDKDNSVPTPRIDKVLIEGETRESYLQTILGKIMILDDISAVILQRQRTMLARIYDPAITVADLLSIRWAE